MFTDIVIQNSNFPIRQCPIVVRHQYIPFPFYCPTPFEKITAQDILCTIATIVCLARTIWFAINRDKKALKNFLITVGCIGVFAGQVVWTARICRPPPNTIYI
ncbi:MAG: hypothetical protein BGO10_03950 [Chlamydia sp. 32-24]|nr:MAG: hypothetical protein BGO10_03950 [Chlamydia sp. 32-24]